MRHVVLVFVTFLCIVFGKRYPRGSNDSVGMIDDDHANRTVPKNALNSIKEKDTNLTRNFENSESVVVVNSGLIFNGTGDSLKNYPNVNQFRLRRTITKDDNLKKIKTGNKKSNDKKKLSARVASSHQDHSKRNHTQKNAIKKSTKSKIPRGKAKGAAALKNKNSTVFGRHRHRHHQPEAKHHSHSIKTIKADQNLKLVTKRLTKKSTQKDFQKGKISQSPKFKRNDPNSSNIRKKYHEWLIFPDHGVNSFNKFQNESMTDAYRRKSIISSYWQPRVMKHKNKVLRNRDWNDIRREVSKRQNFLNYQNSNFNEQAMRKSLIPNVRNVPNVAGQNSVNFGYRVADAQGNESFQKLTSPNSNLKNIPNVKTNVQYGTYFHHGNLGSVGANVAPAANPTTENFMDYPNVGNSQYPNYAQQNTGNYDNFNFGRRSQNNFAESAIPPTSSYFENFDTNIKEGLPEESEDYWYVESDGSVKSFFQDHTSFPSISFTPGKPNNYPGLREIYVKNLNSSLASVSKKERRGANLTDDLYNFDDEYFQKLPTAEILHESRVFVEDSIVPTKLYEIEDFENLYKQVRLFLDRRVKRESDYPLPLAENTKNSDTGSKQKSKSQSNIRSDKKKLRKVSKIDKAESPKRRISGREYSPKKNSIKNRDVDDYYLHFKDNGHDLISEEEQITEGEDEEYSDGISHEDHTSSFIIEEKPETNKIIIFKRDANMNAIPIEDPSASNLGMSEIKENFEKPYSKKKRLTLKLTKAQKPNHAKNVKKKAKINLPKKSAREDDSGSNKNDVPKSESEKMKKLYSRTIQNFPEQDHQADLKYDESKEQDLMTDTMMAEELSDDDLNKNNLIPMKFKENEMMADFIDSKDTPMIIENKEWNEEHLKHNLMTRDKVADNDSVPHTSIESEMNKPLNPTDGNAKNSNRHLNVMTPVDDLPLEIDGRKSWDNLDLPDILTECKNESASMLLPNTKTLQPTPNNDEISPFKTNSRIYKPYVTGARRGSFLKKIINKSKNVTNEGTFVNASNIVWDVYNVGVPEYINYEAKEKMAKGLDVCSEEESFEDKIEVEESGEKEWPISPGPVVCNPDFNVATTFAARPGEYPFVVSIQYKNLKTEELSHICNGIIIGPKYILSAAHCLNNRDNFELVVQRGVNLCNDDSKPIAVALVMEHENYNRHTRLNDLALLRLKHEVDTDQVSMPEHDIITDKFYSVGWGELMWNRFAENVTKIQQKIPLMRYPKKIKEDPGTIYVTTAGLDITGTFRGDYGGVLMNKKKEFIGLRFKINREEAYEVYLRIRTYLPWIENMMKFSKRLLEHPFKFREKKPQTSHR